MEHTTTPPMWVPDTGRLQEARQPGEAAGPRFRLHPLMGCRTGQWSVRVAGHWRVVFRFEDGDAVDVDLIDYHWPQGADLMNETRLGTAPS